MKVVLAVDGSDYTKRMLGYIAAHDELVGKDNQFVAVNVMAAVPPYVAEFLPGEMLQEQRDECEKVLGPVREFARMQGWSLRERQGVGYPGDVLAKIVNEEAPDLLVMGSHGRGAFVGALLGSVATRVLAQTKVPVLLIR